MPAAKTKTFGEAMAAVLADIKSMEKLDTNHFGGYDYVPVDDVYDAVRPILARHGVTIVQNEKSSSVFEANTAKGGKNEFWIKQDFEYCIIYGEETYPIGGNTSVARMSMGSQSCGANASYSMKTFLRSTFLIPMGEYDIDSGKHEEELASHDKSSGRASNGTGASKGEQQSESDGGGDDTLSEDAASEFIDRFTKKLNSKRTAKEVENLYRENRATIDKLPKGQKTGLIGACKVVKEELTNGENLDDQDN